MSQFHLFIIFLSNFSRKSIYHRALFKSCNIHTSVVCLCLFLYNLDNLMWRQNTIFITSYYFLSIVFFLPFANVFFPRYQSSYLKYLRKVFINKLLKSFLKIKKKFFHNININYFFNICDKGIWILFRILL